MTIPSINPTTDTWASPAEKRRHVGIGRFASANRKIPRSLGSCRGSTAHPARKAGYSTFHLRSWERHEWFVFPWNLLAYSVLRFTVHRALQYDKLGGLSLSGQADGMMYF